jgi:SAM-dependent methyltransferase
MSDNNFRDDWWKEYFSKVGHYLVTEGIKWDVKGEVDFIEKAFELPKGSRILDLACGYGRISIELASRGYNVLGSDFSNYFLEIGRSEAIKKKVKVEFVRGDMRDIRYYDEFDGVVCWSNSFGFFSDEENEKVLHLVVNSLKRNGRLMLDLHNKDAVIRNRLGKRWFKKDNFFILSDWSFDAGLSRSNIIETIIDESSGSVRKQVMSMREFTLHEMKRMLKDAGLEFLQVYGDTPKGFTAEGFSIDSSLIILAQKR